MPWLGIILTEHYQHFCPDKKEGGTWDMALAFFKKCEGIFFLTAVDIVY